MTNYLKIFISIYNLSKNKKKSTLKLNKFVSCQQIYQFQLKGKKFQDVKNSLFLLTLQMQ